MWLFGETELQGVSRNCRLQEGTPETKPCRGEHTALPVRSSGDAHICSQWVGDAVGETSKGT